MNLFNESIQFHESYIAKVEETLRAVYVCDTETPSGVLCSVFYSHEPHPVSGSRYFCLYYQSTLLDGKRQMISSAEWVVNQTILGVMHPETKDVIFSRHRHDFRMHDGMMVDGGRDYLKRSLLGETVSLKVVDGVLTLIEEDEEETLQ